MNEITYSITLFQKNKQNPLLNLQHRWEWILYKKREYLKKWFHEDEYGKNKTRNKTGAVSHEKKIVMMDICKWTIYIFYNLRITAHTCGK